MLKEGIRVKIGDVWYSCDELPIMIEFSPEALDHVRNMGPGLTKYSSAPDNAFEDEQHFREWMDNLRKHTPLTTVQISALDEAMRNAGMIPYSSLIANVGTSNIPDQYLGHVGVRSLDHFKQWLEMRFQESISLQATLQLQGDDDSDLLEWAIAHTAMFKETLINFNQIVAKEH